MAKHDDEALLDTAADLATPEVWRDAEPAPRQFVVNVTAFAERARREEERAVTICDEALSGPSSWWAQRLRKIPDSSTAGVVKELLERWRHMVRSTPANALHVTALAIQVANALDIAEYPCDYVVKLRAQAYRDHAFVLSFMGRHPEALEFVERSKRLFDQVPLPEYDLARLGVVKASILREVDRAEEAISVAREAADVFHRFGDNTRSANARLVEASALYECRSVREALGVFLQLDGDPALDEFASVMVKHSIAMCHADLGQPELAAEGFQRCVAEYEILGMETERTRARWRLGHALFVSGRTLESIPVLRTAWRELEQFEMASDAAVAALELAEALLVAGQPDEVPVICRDVISLFTRTGMASRALTALSFLREAVAIGQATPSLVRHVHTFLRELPKEQPRLFAPPPRGMGE
ncbi:MAG TPA: tetratricopeptide repeat protein [Thermoanaerobaculia bacterium]|jgi:tetratricopeptide (TPR) repeat protein